MAPIKMIKVPKTPASAYNPGRPASALLKAQVANLEAAAGIYPGDARQRRRPRTEGEAAKYIEELTRVLHPEGAAPQKAMPVVAAPATVETRRRAGSRGRGKKPSPVKFARARSVAKKAPAAKSPPPRKRPSPRRRIR